MPTTLSRIVFSSSVLQSAQTLIKLLIRNWCRNLVWICHGEL